MRLPLPTNLESRDGDLSQDARLKNCYIDTEENAPNVVKRPGLTLIQTTGDGSIPNDIFVLDGTAYVWRESDPPGTPTVSEVYTQSNQFRDYKFNISVQAPPGIGVNSASGIEESGGSDIKCRVSVIIGDNGITQNAVLGAELTDLAGTTIYGQEILTLSYENFSGLIEVKRESGNYNFYVNSALTFSIQDVFIPFISPSLTSEEVGSASITNLQYIP